MFCIADERTVRGRPDGDAGSPAGPDREFGWSARREIRAAQDHSIGW